jgi:hypothetical protein
VRHGMKRMGHRATGVTRCRRKHRQRLIALSSEAISRAIVAPPRR